jgi:hypothetical protein
MSKENVDRYTGRRWQQFCQGAIIEAYDEEFVTFKQICQLCFNGAERTEIMKLSDNEYVYNVYDCNFCRNQMAKYGRTYKPTLANIIVNPFFGLDVGTVSRNALKRKIDILMKPKRKISDMSVAEIENLTRTDLDNIDTRDTSMNEMQEQAFANRLGSIIEWRDLDDASKAKVISGGAFYLAKWVIGGVAVSWLFRHLQGKFNQMNNVENMLSDINKKIGR